MAEVSYVDDPTIDDRSELWRRIPPWHFVYDDNLGRMRPANYFVALDLVVVVGLPAVMFELPDRDDVRCPLTSRSSWRRSCRRSRWSWRKACSSWRKLCSAAPSCPRSFRRELSADFRFDQSPFRALVFPLAASLRICTQSFCTVLRS